MEMLEGLKTYIIAALVIATGVLNVLGYVSDDIRDTVVVFLVGGGLATLRAGVKKLQ